MTINVLGIDLGASNGRGFLGRYDGNKLSIEEVCRFGNNPIYKQKGIYWDVMKLYGEIVNSIGATKGLCENINSLAVDSWAQDFGLLDENGKLLDNPRHYRDKRTDGILGKVSGNLSEYEIFKITGIYPAGIASLFQLISMLDGEEDVLERARRLLFIPGLMNFFLTGIDDCDLTVASPSHLYNCTSQKWEKSFLNRFGLPDILSPLKSSGGIIGYLSQDVCTKLGVGNIPVVSVAGHDTASAVMAVTSNPYENTAYISCGTWSLIGMNISSPLINMDVFSKGFSNMAGYEKTMLIKCVTGLWVLQECEKEWISSGIKVDYDFLSKHAEKSTFNSFIDPDSDYFLYPGLMCEKVVDYCRHTNQTLPCTVEDTYKCIVTGIALKHAETLKNLQVLTGKTVKRIFMVGGGARNKYLCRLTAKASGIEVAAGPYESAVIGNIAAQLITLGKLKNVDEAKKLVSNSFKQVYYNP